MFLTFTFQPSFLNIKYFTHRIMSEMFLNTEIGFSGYFQKYLKPLSDRLVCQTTTSVLPFRISSAHLILFCIFSLFDKVQSSFSVCLTFLASIFLIYFSLWKRGQIDQTINEHYKGNPFLRKCTFKSSETTINLDSIVYCIFRQAGSELCQAQEKLGLAKSTYFTL